MREGTVQLPRPNVKTQPTSCPYSSMPEKWQEAAHELNSQPVGTRISVEWGTPQKCSFVRTHEGFVRMGDGSENLLGEGAFGRVVACQAWKFNGQEVEGPTLIAMKIITHSHAMTENEARIAKDLGGMAEAPFAECHAKNQWRFWRSPRERIYLPMIHAGMSLADYLRNYRLNRDQQYELAIRILLKIRALHSGELSKTNTRYAHQDIKPENLTIDSNGELHLIDFGLSVKNPDKKPNFVAGTHIYMPTNFSEKSPRNLDCFAAKRTIFLSKQFYCRGSSGKQVSRPCNRVMVFTDETCDQEPELKDLLNTQHGHCTNLNATELVVQLILLQHRLLDANSVHQIRSNPTVCQQIIERRNNKDSIVTLLRNPFPEANARQSNHPTRANPLTQNTDSNDNLLSEKDIEIIATSWKPASPTTNPTDAGEKLAAYRINIERSPIHEQNALNMVGNATVLQAYFDQNDNRPLLTLFRRKILAVYGALYNLEESLKNKHGNIMFIETLREKTDTFFSNPDNVSDSKLAKQLLDEAKTILNEEKRRQPQLFAHQTVAAKVSNFLWCLTLLGPTIKKLITGSALFAFGTQANAEKFVRQVSLVPQG